MHDILPVDMPVWNRLEDEYRALVEEYYRKLAATRRGGGSNR